MGVDLHHIKTRKSGGTDDAWNLMPLCRQDHTRVHGLGLKKFVTQYKPVAYWLIENGWEFDDFRGKWVRYEQD